MERIGYCRKQICQIRQTQLFVRMEAGFVVPWYEVPDYMHIEGMEQESEEEENASCSK